MLDGGKCGSPWLLVPLRQLIDHDVRGGHAYSVHVAQSVKELHTRLLSDPNLDTVSTFWSIESATAAVCHLTMAHLGSILRWFCAARAGSRLPIEGDVPAKSSVGYAIIRGDKNITLCRRAIMVLERDVGEDFHIHTGYPVP